MTRTATYVAAVAGAIAVALLVLATVGDDGPAGRGLLDLVGGYDLVEPQGQVLEIPEPGESYPAWLRDGRPVFVSREADGTVHVVEATDSHGEGTEGVLWCATSGWFEEPLHGTKFDGGGRWLGGPGPLGLLRFTVTVDGRAGTVEVGPPVRRLGRGEEPDRRSEPLGPMCAEETGAVLEGARFHVRPEGRLPEVEDLVRRGRGWHVTDVHLDGQGRLCSPRHVIDGGCGDGGVVARTVPFPRPGGERFLAAVEVEGDTLSRVIRLVTP